MKKIKISNNNVNILDVILIVNIILKFTNLIDWGWYVVLWPLWVELFVIILILGDIHNS